MLYSQFLYFLKHNLSARALGKKQPLLAGFKLTYRCTLQCRTCPFWKLEPQDISYVAALKVLDEFYRQGVRLLIFEGGEPFLWRDQPYQLDDLVLYAKQKFFRVGITTNGTLSLKSSADLIWVSIDGLKDAHDKNRGTCFDRVIANIKQSDHPRIFANVTISKLNYHDIAALVKFISPLVKGITIQFYYPFPNSENLRLPPAARFQVLKELAELKKAGYPILDSTVALKKLQQNTWRCHAWLIANAEPDGRMNIGCYLKDRAEIACDQCGFAAHAEISLAYDWHPGAIVVGNQTFDFVS